MVMRLSTVQVRQRASGQGVPNVYYVAGRTTTRSPGVRHGTCRMSCGCRTTIVRPSPSLRAFRQCEMPDASGAQSSSVRTSAGTPRAGIGPSRSCACRRRPGSEGSGMAAETRSVRTCAVTACAGSTEKPNAPQGRMASSQRPRFAGTSRSAATGRTRGMAGRGSGVRVPQRALTGPPRRNVTSPRQARLSQSSSRCSRPAGGRGTRSARSRSPRSPSRGSGAGLRAPSPGPWRGTPGSGRGGR